MTDESGLEFENTNTDRAVSQPADNPLFESIAAGLNQAIGYQAAMTDKADMEKVREAAQAFMDHVTALQGDETKSGSYSYIRPFSGACKSLTDAAQAIVDAALIDQQKPATPEMTEPEIFATFIKEGAENHTLGAGVPFIKMDTSVLYRAVRAIIKAVK